MGGGSGPSGKVEYPNYIESMQGLLMFNRPYYSFGNDVKYQDADGKFRDFHRNPPHSWEDFVDNWTNASAEGTATDANTQGIMFAADTMIGNNPFTGVLTYDPDASSELLKVADALVVLDTEIDSMDTYIQDELNAFEDEAKLSHYRSMAVMAGSFRDINAVVSTSFLQGITSHQINHDNKLARARGEAFKTRTTLIERRATLQMEASKIQIIARNDQIEKDTNLSLDDQNWELDTLIRALSGIGAIAGVATTTAGSKGPSSAQRMLGGAASGAAAGTMIAPGPGTAIGAVLGAALGAA